MGQNQENGITIYEKVNNAIQSLTGDIKSALPPDMNGGAERFIQSVKIAFRRNPALFTCTVQSVKAAVLQAAHLGLELDPTRQLAYLIPRNRTLPDSSRIVEATFMPGYRGLIHLALKNADLVDIYAEIVYENEKFEYTRGSNPSLNHVPLPPDQRGKAIQCVYAVARRKEYPPTFVVMWPDEIEKVRNVSAAKNRGPWKDWPEEMTRKCPVRRLSKWLPLSEQFQTAAAIDEAFDTTPIQQDNGDDIHAAIEGLASKPEVQIPEAADDDPGDAPPSNDYDEQASLALDKEIAEKKK